MATTNLYYLLPFLFVLLCSTIGQKEDYRLPNHVEPVKYKLKLTPDFPTEPEKIITDFWGEVTIEAKVHEDNDTIVLHHGLNITFEEIKVTKDGNTESIPYEKATYNNETHKLSIPFLVKKDEDIIIDIKYNGKLQPDMSGFYLSTYNVAEGDARERTAFLLATQFESTSARKAFPCFDEPHFKSTFEISITVPEKYLVLSNTLKKNTARDKNDAHSTRDDTTIEFEETVPMPTYLLAFLIYEKDTYDSSHKVVSKSDVDITSWGRKSTVEEHLTDYSQEVTHRILEELEKFTNIPYKNDSMVKIDQAAIPDFSAGAMENWGLVTYREDNLFFSEVNSTEADRRGVAMVIAHELTHQWFGNLVTTDWWSSTWLNEGFARYFQYYIVSLIYPSWRLMERFVVDHQLVVFANDALTSAKQITLDVYTPTEISGQFSSSAYSKGGCVVRLISLIMGEEEFREGLQNYLTKMSFKTATPEDLFDALSEVWSDETLGNETLANVLKTWTEQPGFPVISVTQDTEKNINLKQERFLLEDESDSNKILYSVKLTAAFKDKKEEKSYWLIEEEGTYESSDTLLIIKNSGYFRINYEVSHWQELTEILQKDQKTIAPLERATLVDDALNLARTGKIEYSTTFSLLSYLKDENDYIPWAAASNALDFLYKMMGEDDDFQQFVKIILGNVYEELGFKDHGDHLTKIHRTTILRWACRVDHEGCRNSSAEILTNSFDEKTLVPANLRSIVYCYAVKGKGLGPETLWNKLWYLFKENQDVSERSLLISALGCTDSKSTLYMYLEETLMDRYIRSQDAGSVFSAVYNNHESGVDVAIDFLAKNFLRIKEVYNGMNALENAVKGVASQVITEEQEKKFLDFLEDNESDEKLAEYAESAKATVETNRNWIKNKKDEVIEAIKAVNA